MKTLKLLVAVGIVMSLLMVSAMAAFPDQDSIEHIEAVEMNVALKIMQGRTDGNFDPQGQVTRAEMAKIICLIQTGGKEPTCSSKETSRLKDVQGHWAESYIEYCTDLGIVSGSGDGKFNPDDKVTSTQAAKMLLVTLGYDAEREQFNSPSWFVKINAAANQKKLYQDLTIDPNATLSRDEAAQMIWNALNASEIVYQDNGMATNGITNLATMHEDRKGNLLRSKFNTDGAYVGMMTSCRWVPEKQNFIYEIKDQGSFSSKSDYTYLTGLDVTVVYQNDAAMTLYGIFRSNSKVLASGVVGDLKSGTTATELQFNNTSFEIDYAVPELAVSPLDALPVYVENNGETFETYGSATLARQKLYEARLIDQDGNGKVNYMIYRPFTIGKVSSVGVTSVTVKDLKNFEIIPGQTVITLLYTDNHKKYPGIKKDDYVKIIPEKTTPYKGHELLLLKPVEGIVMEVKDDKIRVNETWYYNGNDLALLKNIKYRCYIEGTYLYYAEKISE